MIKISLMMLSVVAACAVDAPNDRQVALASFGATGLGVSSDSAEAGPTAEEMDAMEASAVRVTQEAFDALTGGATTQLEGCQYWTICNESPRFDGGAETNGECPDGHTGEDKYLCCTSRFGTQCCWGSSRPYSCDAGGGPISPNNPPSAPLLPGDDFQ